VMGRRILAFDLDETLISSEVLYDSKYSGYILTKITVNEALLQVIYNAKNLGYLVLLLTNNNNAKVLFNGKEGKFIDIAIKELTDAYARKYKSDDPLFNRILTAEKIKNMKRTYLKKRVDIQYKTINGKIHTEYYSKPVKSLKDVTNMLGYPVKGEDVYFFDDDSEHKLCKESNFIHITPPFGKGEDKTNFSLLRHINEENRPPKKRGQTRRKLKDSRHII
jgi:hypothetical protein